MSALEPARREIARSAAEATRGPGALVMGADYRALGVVRSLGRRGIPVWLLVDEHVLAATSRYVRRRIHVPKGSTLSRLQFLMQLAEDEGLDGWTLVPTNDLDTELAARHHARLSKHFLVSVPGWEAVRWAHDKRLAYALAERHGVAHPWTVVASDEEALTKASGHFPVIVKPAYKPEVNALTAAKAWWADDASALRAAYREACRLMPATSLLIQEFVPGDGATQFSHASLAIDGQVIASLCARRVRQWPMRIGRASTFVETIIDPEVDAAGERLLAAMRFTGLIEIEFKRDPNGVLQLLDMNPRVWGWHSVGARAGVDFPYLLWRHLHGKKVEAVKGRPGIRWVRLATDLPTAFSEVARGRLSVGDWVRAFRGPLEGAVFAPDDPLPGLCEVPLIARLLLHRRGL
jgi:D-aspartate ligase